MTQLLADILDGEVILAADRWQRVGGGPVVTENNHATKLVSNTHLLVAVAGDWPTAPPLDQPNVWLANWLTQNAQLTRASDAAAQLRHDLSALQPTCRVAGGVMLIGSCCQGTPELMAITRESFTDTDHRLNIVEPSRLASPTGNPLARGVFNSWDELAAAVRLPNIPSRTDPRGRRAFLQTTITECQNAGVPCIRGPALVEWRPN